MFTPDISFGSDRKNECGINRTRFFRNILMFLLCLG